MNTTIDSTLIEGDDDPVFLRATPEGFEDEDGETYHELTAQLITAKRYVKLFEGREVVHTSDVCGDDPDCPECNDPRARVYARLLLEVDGGRFILDVPPSGKRRFAKLARKGINGLLRLTTTPVERRGVSWGSIQFEEAA